jgi:hypothetical protein
MQDSAHALSSVTLDSFSRLVPAKDANDAERRSNDDNYATAREIPSEANASVQIEAH